MRRIKRIFAITLLALMVGLGTPAVFADGNAESPGVTSTQTTETTITVDGNAESPGIYATAIMYLDIIV